MLSTNRVRGMASASVGLSVVYTGTVFRQVFPMRALLPATMVLPPRLVFALESAMT